MRTFVIAEAGSTVAGSLPRMLDMIVAASDTGADAIKFQWTSSGKRMASRRALPSAASSYDTLLGWPSAWLPLLADAAKALNVEFMCSVFLPEDVAIVAPYVSRFKIASIEAADLAFLQAHPLDRQIIVSAGACGQRTLDQLIAFRAAHAGTVAVIHCNAGYPTPLADANLRVITRHNLDGFSDHTAHILTGALAVAAGARIVEVHFRHPETASNNPDYWHSLDFHGLECYIETIRHAETALGSGHRRITATETECANAREALST